MKKFLLLLCCLTAVFAATNPPPFTDDDAEDFYEQLQDALQASERRVHNLVMEKANNRTIFTHQKQIILESARNAMETKYTLYSNFYDTPSIESPRVRRKLLKIFQSDQVTSDDLQDLQTAVFQWQRQ